MSAQQQKSPEIIREAVGVFKSMQDLNEAVAELETTAFPRQDISVLGSSAYAAKQAADNPDAPRTVLVRPEEKTIGAAVIIGGGAYAGTVTAALLAGPLPLPLFFVFFIAGAVLGAALGFVIVQLIAAQMQRRWERHMQHGGVVLWVRTPGPNRERLACDILRRHGGREVHVHNTH